MTRRPLYTALITALVCLIHGLCAHLGASPAPPSLDVWVLAGQSNMSGGGVVRPSHVDPRVRVFGMNNRWTDAREPIHRVFEAEAPAYHDTMLRIWPDIDESIYQQFRSESLAGRPWGGVGPGGSFGARLASALNRPIGLVPCALGATDLACWDYCDKSTRSLYGAMLDRIRRAGGTLKGVLWYQGEYDANDPEHAAQYGNRFAEWAKALREDTGRPDLPIIAIQIARWCSLQPDTVHRGWEVMRETQRMLPSLIPNLWVVAAADLELDDMIHLSMDGQQRLGRRLAEVALANVYQRGRCQGPIDLESVQRLAPERNADVVRVRFRGVTGRLRSAGRITGFSIRCEQPGPCVFQASLDPKDPHAVILRVSPRIQGEASLMYGAGLDPCIHLTDGADLAVPAFGPVPIR